MNDRRTKNIEIFNDTMELISNNETLRESVKESIEKQKMYPEDIMIPVPLGPMRACSTVISKKRSLEAAAVYAREGKKVCVLNFASATNPGGGVVNGSSAQEESLCRVSTLYPCLATDELWEKFYSSHRKNGNTLYNDDCIYTPGITVFKSDISFPERIGEEEWVNVDILTMAAPNLRNISISDDELYNIHYKRITRLFQVAVLNEAEVLILGAFGCGAFRNNPGIVAKAFFDVQSEYGVYFDNIEYAVFCTVAETRNYDAFNNVFKY